MNIVALTGAGISKASGIPTYDEKPYLKVLFQLTAFEHQPTAFWTGFNEVIDSINNAKPNDAHKALAEYGVSVITQNIDGLHQDGGSKSVIELHGTAKQIICLSCGKVVKKTEDGICKCGGRFKPNVVLYGEEVTQFPYALDRVMKADVLLVIGTALQVSTTATLVDFANSNNAKVIEINDNAETEVRRILKELKEDGM